MKIKLRYVIIFIMLSIGIVKCIEIHNYLYPRFSMKSVGEYPRFCHAIYDLNYDLFFFDILEDEYVESRTRNIFRQQNAWEEKEFIGQKLNFYKSSPRDRLDVELYISDCTLPSHMVKLFNREGQQIDVNGTEVLLVNQPEHVHLELNEVSYKFEFELNGFYIFGSLYYEQKEQNLMTSDSQREEYFAECLKQIFFPEIEHSFELPFNHKKSHS